ncbi:MAG: hypothetical protein SVM86_01575 [Candidatus Cloacimonadota bacterium]|nr:hypothetical protein [Candidatus Cloacimonadota bacterium]
MKKIIWLSLIFTNILLFSQNFDIKKFSNPQKYGWENYEDMKAFRQDLYLRKKLLTDFEKQKKSASLNALKASALPGWGHFATERYTKGNIILGLEIILLGTSYVYYDKAMDQYEKYKDSNYIEDIHKYYDEANRPYKTSQVFLGLALGVWLYNIYDAILQTNEYNTEIWQKIYSENITITPGSISVRF